MGRARSEPDLHVECKALIERFKAEAEYLKAENVKLAEGATGIARRLKDRLEKEAMVVTAQVVTTMVERLAKTFDDAAKVDGAPGMVAANSVGTKIKEVFYGIADQEAGGKKAADRDATSRDPARK